MVEITPKYRTKEECEAEGHHWITNFCFWDAEGTDPITIGGFEELTGIDVAHGVMDFGMKAYTHWIKLAYEKPPEGLIDRFLWDISVLGQVLLSSVTAVAGIGAFLLEEGCQAYGMGAYMLSTSDAWDTLDTYLDGYKEFIKASEMGAKSLATINPILGGAVVIYTKSAMKQYEAFKAATMRQLAKRAVVDVAARKRYLAKKYVMELRLSSIPSDAEIWIRDTNLEVLTPETIKFVDLVGLAKEKGLGLAIEGMIPVITGKLPSITLRKYNKTREEWDIYTFTTTFRPGRHVEKRVIIPTKITSDEEEKAKEIYGEIRIFSAPSEAMITLDGTPTDLLTPETFDELTPGSHDFSLSRYMPLTKTTAAYTGSFTIAAGVRKEIKVNLVDLTQEEEETPEDGEEDEEDQLPTFLTAEVTGEYAKDGDTFITTQDETIRLIGIDAPELGRPYASIATKFLQDSIEDKQLTIKIQTDRPFDTYGRTLAEVRNYKGNINVALLSAGLARQDWFEEDKFDRTRYQAAEDMARQRGVGIWGGIPKDKELPPDEPPIPAIPGVEITAIIEPIMLDAYVRGAEAITGDVFITDEKEFVHILGIMAPPEGQTLFEESRRNLDNYIKDKNVHLYIQSNRMLDTLGNTYAVVKVGALNMAIEQLRDGLALQQVATTDIYDTREYLEHERLARARGIGIWSG